MSGSGSDWGLADTRLCFFELTKRGFRFSFSCPRGVLVLETIFSFGLQRLELDLLTRLAMHDLDNVLPSHLITHASNIA